MRRLTMPATASSAAAIPQVIVPFIAASLEAGKAGKAAGFARGQAGKCSSPPALSTCLPDSYPPALPAPPAPPTRSAALGEGPEHRHSQLQERGEHPQRHRRQRVRREARALHAVL